MAVIQEQADIANSVLQKIDNLTNKLSLDFTDKNLFTEFEYKRLCRDAESIKDKAKSFALLALLRLNYDRNLEAANELFTNALRFKKSDDTIWTYYPGIVSIRGFASAAHKLTKESLNYVINEGILCNACVNAIMCLDVETMSRCVEEYQKRYPKAFEHKSLMQDAVVLTKDLEMNITNVEQQKQISEILLAVQDLIGNLGFTVKGAVDYSYDRSVGTFMGYKVNVENDDQLGDINMSIAEMFAENDWLDMPLRVMVFPKD